jgi:hypothetical protein
MDIFIKKSKKNNKKYDAIFNDKIISFGAKKYSDYTINKDDNKKENYIKRHKVNEDFTKEGLKTPGFLSRFILWNKPTIKESIKDLNSKYKDVKFTLID